MEAGRPPGAVLEHAPFAFWLVDALRPRTFPELGTPAGFSYLTLCQAVARHEAPDVRPHWVQPSSVYRSRALANSRSETYFENVAALS